MYSDATTTDSLGKNSLHPIYISIGNISISRRNKPDAKQLLGYLPILSAKSKKEKNSPAYKKIKRETFHHSLRFLLDPLFSNNLNVDLEVNGETLWFSPRLSTVICDWPEASTFSLVYKSPNSNFLCHFCLISYDRLLDINLNNRVTLRNNEEMRNYVNRNDGHAISLENIRNYFWALPNVNIYTATVPDRMHHLDLGLFKYQLDYTRELLHKQNSSLVSEFDRRLSAIPRFTGLKIFANGLHSISKITAKEYRDLMKVVIFVVENLYKENSNNVDNFVSNKKITELYVLWNEMYIMSRAEIFTESDIILFQVNFY